MKIFAIDPGNTESAYVLVDFEKMEILDFGKLINKELEQKISCSMPDTDYIETVYVCEMIASYGMPVGREVFDTCIQIGRFEYLLKIYGPKLNYITRMEEKMAICHDSRANDATIRRALIDMYAKHDLKNGKGTKKNPDFFYGFKADIWAAFAVAHTYYTKHKEENTCQHSQRHLSGF